MRILRRRRGVTLLITLSVIAAMLTLIGVLFGYLERARSRADSRAALVQSDLLREDVKDMFRRFLTDKASDTALQTLYNTSFLLPDKSGTFVLRAECKALFDRIPIFWLGFKGEAKRVKEFELAKELFDALAEKAEIREPERLYEMIADTLKGHPSRFGLERRVQKREGFLGKTEFIELLDEYRFKTDDSNVYNVPWTDYFLFRGEGSSKDGVDAEHLAPAVIAYLYDEEVAVVRENYHSGNLKEFLSDLGERKDRYAWLFEKRVPPALRCRLQYSFRERQYNISFDYIGKRMENFEIQTD